MVHHVAEHHAVRQAVAQILAQRDLQPQFYLCSEVVDVGLLNLRQGPPKQNFLFSRYRTGTLRRINQSLCQCCRAGGGEIILLSRNHNLLFRLRLHGSGAEIFFLIYRYRIFLYLLSSALLRGRLRLQVFFSPAPALIKSRLSTI